MKFTPATPIASLGFNLATTKRLSQEGVCTLGDLILKEERVTERRNAKNLLKQLKLSTRTQIVLENYNVGTIKQLLEIDPVEIMKCRNFGWQSLFEIISELKRLKFTSEDGKFLDDEFLLRMIHSNSYNALLKLRETNSLSKEFVEWYNALIDGHSFNISNRPGRTTFVKKL